ncbi:MAG: thiamine diphosphokinase [Niabella sp.]
MKKIIFPTADYHADTAILANGEFPTHALPLSILQNAAYLVCCDGATNQLLQHTDRLPDAIVGDCDSISPENRQRFSDIIHCIPEQETNDQTKAVNFCLSRGRLKITILGATGRREDHTIGNVSLLAKYLAIPGTEIQMITDHGIFVAINTDAEFESFAGQQVSIFNMGGASVSSQNLKYPLAQHSFSNWWQGTLNESLSETFQLTTDNCIVVFLSF